MIRLVVKQPAELVDLPVLAGAALVSATASVTARGQVPGAAALVAAVVAGAGTVRLSGGGDGERYLVTIVGQLGDGERREEEIEVAVIDAAWSMPDGGAPYLSIGAFVVMYGYDETVAMTGAGDGRIDTSLLIAALVAAQGVADTNLAARYAVPIGTAPAAIKTAIGDIARARLYPRGAPDGVATAAKDAVRLLERIASGAVPLGLPPAEAPAAAAGTDPVLFRPGRTRLGCAWGE